MKKKDLEKYNSGLLDFHTHSTVSDGGDTPTGLVKRAKEQGVTAMALTDHHQISGLPEFITACENYNIFPMPFGTEISVELPEKAIKPEDHKAPDMIILGKNPKNEQKAMANYHNILEKDFRERFIPGTISYLKKMGFKFPVLDLGKKSIKEWFEIIENIKTILTQKENLEVLINHIQKVDPGTARDEIEKNPIRYPNKYVFSIGQPGYLKRFEGFSLKDGINLAEEMNCKLFIAHPGGEFGAASDFVLNHYIKQGAPGIETRSYFNTDEQNSKFDGLASKYNLIRTGGSDCHGNKGPFKIGMYDRPQNQVPKDVLEELMDRLPS